MNYLLKYLVLGPIVAVGLATPSLGAPAKPAAPSKNCLQPHALLTALTSAGDWIIKRDPAGVADEKLTGLVFRQANMINVAVFQDGCLAMIVVVGKSPPDLKV